MCKYVYAMDGVEYAMALSIRRTGPYIVFFSRKLPAADYGEYYAYQYSRAPRKVSVKLRVPIDTDTVTEADLEQWFSYLLSRFQESPTAHRALFSYNPWGARRRRAVAWALIIVFVLAVCILAWLRSRFID